MANNVSATNLTSLYGGSGNTVSLATVAVPTVDSSIASRNLTTLYSSAGAPVIPTSPYGNANVERFLNAGTDGGNSVTNINMSGDLTVGGESNLGVVGNVHITGGQLNYILTTDGGGGLSWEPPGATVGSIIPFIHFDVLANGNNQQFTNANLSFYSSNVQFVNLMKNGVNIDPTNFQFINATTIQVDVLLATGDSIDVLATGSGGGGAPGGNVYEVQYNDGLGGFAGNSSFTFFQANSTLTTGNLVIPGTSDLGDVSNVVITGGTANYVLKTDGAGNLSWTAQTGGGNITVQDEGSNIVSTNIMNFVGAGVTVSNVANVATITIPGGGGNANGNTFANGITLLNNSNIDLLSAGNGSPVGTSNINADFLIVNSDMGVYPKTTGGFFVDATGGGTVSFIANTKFNEAVGSGGVGKTVELGNVATLKITGGSNGQILTTDGSTNLSWTSNLPYLQISNSANADGVINQFASNNITFATNFSNIGTYQLTTIYHPNNFTGYPADRIIRSRGNATSPTTAVSVDRISQKSFHAYNGNTNPLAISEVFTAVGTVNANTTAQWTGGQWNMTTGNPDGNTANQASLTFQNQLIFTNSGSLQINPGGPANTSLGQSGTPILITNYGLSTTDLVGVGGMNQQKARGNRDAPLSVQPSDNLGRWNSWGYNGSAYSTANVGSITMYVDGSYVANSAIIPINISFTSRSNTGASSTRQFYGNGVSTFPGDITTTGNITANTGTLTNLTVSGNLLAQGNVTVQRAFEVFTPNSTGSTGTVDFDVLTQSIINKTANATANCTINIRGNSSVTLDTMLPTNNSVTVAYLNTVGATAYIVNALTIDGTSVTPKYVFGSTPTTGTRVINCTQSYTYTILKTAANTYTVLGSFTEYQ